MSDEAKGIDAVLASASGDIFQPIFEAMGNLSGGKGGIDPELSAKMAQAGKGSNGPER